MRKSNRQEGAGNWNKNLPREEVQKVGTRGMDWSRRSNIASPKNPVEVSRKGAERLPIPEGGDSRSLGGKAFRTSSKLSITRGRPKGGRIDRREKLRRRG